MPYRTPSEPEDEQKPKSTWKCWFKHVWDAPRQTIKLHVFVQHCERCKKWLVTDELNFRNEETIHVALPEDIILKTEFNEYDFKSPVIRHLINK